jgi:AAA+ superfamily predicted ATPase
MIELATVIAASPAWLARVRLRAERRVLWLRHLWGSAADTRTLAISDDDVDQILADRQELAAAERDFYHHRTPELNERIERAELLVGDDAALALLRERFDLSAAELDLLTMCVAVEGDPLLRRVFGYLHDDATLGHPTPWLAASLFGWPALPSLDRSSPLLHWRLARPVEGFAIGSAAAPWSADPFATSLILDGRLVDAALGEAVELMEPATIASELLLYPRAVDDAETFVRALSGSRPRHSAAPMEVELIGARGSGKRTAAMQLCARLGIPMLAVDGAALMQGADTAASAERIRRVGRLARAAGAAIYWRAAAEVDPRGWSALAGSCELAILGSESPRLHGGTAPRKTIVLPPIDGAARRELWQRLTDTAMPEEAVRWQLTPAELVGVAAVAPAGAEELAAACRRLVHRTPGELFSPLPSPYSWDDLVVAPTLRQHLGELEDQARHRGAVFDEWGFARLHPLSRGLSALFAGPSGTGKTMAAQVLARSLGLELYRVDLAGVVNKYIGETEKRLKLVFDACERANVLLFFDEADALFGQRTQVKDAHDRFANIEIDYLLQRMEEFDGLAILATNRKSDLDKAFVRRLRFIIEFLHPGPAERLALWRRALPERTPAGEPLLAEIDFERLAAELAVTGADIKAAALGAAFLARAAGTRIGMSHVVSAVRRVMTKHGIELRGGLGVAS